MDYGMIGKIEKAKKYAEQRDRFTVETLTVTFTGDNNPHKINLMEVTGTVTVTFSRPAVVAVIPWRWKKSWKVCKASRNR